MIRAIWGGGGGSLTLKPVLWNLDVCRTFRQGVGELVVLTCALWQGRDDGEEEEEDELKGRAAGSPQPTPEVLRCVDA